MALRSCRVSLVEQHSFAVCELGVSFGLGSFGGSTGFGLGIGTGIGGGGGEDFRAQADVLMYKGEKPEDRSDALNAAEVKANLEAGIRRPN